MPPNVTSHNQNGSTPEIPRDIYVRSNERLREIGRLRRDSYRRTESILREAEATVAIQVFLEINRA